MCVCVCKTYACVWDCVRVCVCVNCLITKLLWFQLVCERADLFASACAIARAFPLYMGKSNLSEALRVVTVEVVLVGQGSDEALSDADIQALCVAGNGVRLAAKITDMPCSEMHTDAFLQVGVALSVSHTGLTNGLVEFI